jgi:hypothetical protein
MQGSLFGAPEVCPFCKRAGSTHQPGCIREPKTPRAAIFPSKSRDEGIDRSVAAANVDWLTLGIAIGEEIARTRQFLTSADIDLAMMQRYPHIRTHEKRAMAGVMAALKARGIIEATRDFLADPRENCHAQNKRVWRSLVYVPV